MIICNKENEALLKQYASQISTLLQTYDWLTNLYVSDFYHLNHWEKLPRTWQYALKRMTTQQLSGFLDNEVNRPTQSSSVVPLSLLSFKVCTQTFSVNRQCHKNLEEAFDTLFSKNKERVQKLQEPTNKQLVWSEVFSTAQNTKKTNETENDMVSENCCITHQENATKSNSPGDVQNKGVNQDDVKQFLPTDEDGRLHYLFQKHVKPKKRHEILQLGNVISLLSECIGCDHVVDVGAGLGHLSRLLSFGHGLKVTSVEAAGTHAPKATKYDREIDREIKKKKTKSGTTTPMTTTPQSSFPCHVTSMIYSNMTSHEFLHIIKSQQALDKQSVITEGQIKHQLELDARTKEDTVEVDDQTFKEIKIGSCVCDLKRIYMMNNTINTDYRGKQTSHIESNRENDFDLAKQVKECHGFKSKESNFKDKSLATSRQIISDNQTKHLKNCDKKDDISKIDNQKNGDTISTDIESKCFNDTISASTNLGIKTCHGENNSVTENSEKTILVGIEHSNSEKAVLGCEEHSTCEGSTQHSGSEGFILTGLHACGDLTPTFLRFYVNCSSAQGLASVGCCYMKLSGQSSTYGDLQGYPMSEFVSNLPKHQLSYNARELACHFADTYSQRLKDGSAHLKIHSYRAALEWLANKLSPHFGRASVQLPSKKSNQLDFQSYAVIGLKKLGISPDLMTPDLLDEAVTMTTQWKDVVALYTLRLSLAPVVETLVLLDRMFYLLQHGYTSALIPIFDPSVSPRNFVMLSWK